MTHQEMLEIGKRDMKEKFGITFPRIEGGEAVGELILKPHHRNFYGVPYGGVLFALADNTAGLAALSAGHIGVTASGHVDFMRGSVGAERLTCEAKVLKTGKTLAFVEATVRDEQGTELCKFSFIFSRIVPVPPEPGPNEGL